MAYVKFKLTTDRVGCDTEEVYEVEDTSNEYLDSVGYDLARDNAEMYGIEQQDDDCEEPFDWSWEILLNQDKESLEEEYGCIQKL